MNFINTCKDSYHFVTAREFWRLDDDMQEFPYQKNLAERFGSYLIAPLTMSSDSALRHIREPHVITAFTICALASATLFFYPEESAQVIMNLLPFASCIQPWAVKFAVYLASQSLIMGFGLRTFGRFTNAPLTTAWKANSLLAIPIGAMRK